MALVVPQPWRKPMKMSSARKLISITKYSMNWDLTDFD